MAGGKTYNAVEVDPTDPTVGGMVYQVTQVDPTDPHTQGKVYQVNMQGGGGGGVTSVNGKTGAVVLGAEDVNAAPQYSSMPVASTDNLGDIVQFVGTTDTSYTNGYFYKCVSDGQNSATYSWQQANVQPSSGGGLPSQAGNAGKFLTTDGTDASWATVDALPSQTGYSGRVLGTDGFVAGWVEPEIVQRGTMPVASADELGNIYQFVGTTDASYTNGYFYKCVSDGLQPATYSWSAVDVQASSGGLPSQTGHNGEFLTTNGTNASWSGIPIVEDSTNNNLTIATSNTIPSGTSNNIAIGSSSEILGSGNGNVAIGKSAQAGVDNNNIAIGTYAHAANGSVHIGHQSALGTKSISIIGTTSSEATQAIQLGGGTNGSATNSDANTFKYANANGNFEIISADGTMPTDRLTHAINKYSTMPTASASNEGWIVQFIGTTDSTYTHGYIYECVSDGGNPATYSWSAVQVQAGSGGSLPSQTGNAGKFLTTDGTDASWGTISALQNIGTGINTLFINGSSSGAGTNDNYNVILGKNAHSTGGSKSVAIGSDAVALSAGVVSIGHQASAWGEGSIAIGYYPKCSNAKYAIQLGGIFNNCTNSDANTFKVGNENGNFEIMSADGTVPTARLTKVNTTVTLAAADWSANTQTVSVTGMTATGIVFVNPDPSDQADYTSAGILCTAQAAGTLTFTCDTTPSNDIDVVVVCL